MWRYDVAVVGSGPAGSSAALALARNGAAVALLEREALPRYKTCGGGVVFRAMRIAGVSLAPVTERRCETVALHFQDTHRHFVVRRDGPLITMTMRDSFDMLLAEAAVAAGAELLAPCRVRAVTAGRGSVRLGTDRGDVDADFVIAADGALSDVTRLAGWPDDRRSIPALEYEVTLADAAFERLAAEPRFDLGSIPHGYGWVFPKREHLSVGVLSMHRGARDLHAHLESYLTLVGIANPREVKRHGFVIPIRPRSGALVRNRILVVGDAAGFADPVTAEGISFAIRSGQLAAAALLAARGDEALAGAAYHDALEREIFPELRTGRVLAALLYEGGVVQRGLVRAAGRDLAEGMADVFCGGSGYRDIPARVVRRVCQLAT